MHWSLFYCCQFCYHRNQTESRLILIAPFVHQDCKTIKKRFKKVFFGVQLQTMKPFSDRLPNDFVCVTWLDCVQSPHPTCDLNIYLKCLNLDHRESYVHSTVIPGSYYWCMLHMAKLIFLHISQVNDLKFFEKFSEVSTWKEMRKINCDHTLPILSKTYPQKRLAWRSFHFISTIIIRLFCKTPWNGPRIETEDQQDASLRRQTVACFLPPNQMEILAKISSDYCMK